MEKTLLIAKEALEELYGSDKSIIAIKAIKAIKAINTVIAQPLKNNVATYTCGICGISMSMETDKAQHKTDNSVEWNKVDNLNLLNIGDVLRISKNGVMVKEINFYLGYHDFDLVYSESERLLIGDKDIKQIIKTSYKNQSCTPINGWKVEILSAPSKTTSRQ